MQKERELSRGSVLERVRRRLRTDKRLEWVLYGGLVLAAVLLYAAGMRADTSEKETGRQESSASAAATVTTEERLQQVLSCIRGAGRVEVMITYESGKEIVTAMTTNTNTSSSESRNGSDTSLSSQVNETSQPATRDGADGSEPIVLYEKEPEIRGVIVVAEGASDVTVRLDLQRAVCAVLDVPISAVEVFERSGSETAEALP